MNGTINPEIAFPELRIDRVQTPYLKQIGCPVGHMPYLMQPLDPNKGVWFPWCHWNPFQPVGRWAPGGAANTGARSAGDALPAAPSGYGRHASGWQAPAMFDGLVGMPSWKVLVRVFGWVEKMRRLAIGNFNPQVHIIPHERIARKLAEGKLTTAMGDDPETQRSHFLIWRGVDEDGLNYIFDECPTIDEGEWVNASGERGEGQRVYAGVGSNFYKRLIRERERTHGTEPVLRLGDPRGFATEESTENGTRNMFELFDTDGSNGDPDEDAMHFEPAKIRKATTLDLDNLITLLQFDFEKAQRDAAAMAPPEQGEERPAFILSVENRPRLYVSDRCQNFIKAVMNYHLPETARASDDGNNPWKDPIDAARYVFSVPLEYVDQAKPRVRGGGGWG